jgi:hypothetical protein
MAGKKRDKVEQDDLMGFKYFKPLSKMLERLHGAACQSDRAHNRQLHMDQYILLLLLHFFNPICTSLRAIQEASDLEKVQRKLGVSRAALGSLSEAARVFDSELMVEILQELAVQLKPLPHDPRLREIQDTITLVDGTWLRALPKITWALWQDPRHNAVKAHVEFELLKGVPVKATITEGQVDERTVLAENLRPGRLYVGDRGNFQYSLMQKIIDADSRFVLRIRDNAVIDVVEERELSDEALAAGVVRDAVVWLGGPDGRKDLRQKVRIVEVECTPHVKSHKTGRGGPEQGQTILIATSLLDVPAEVISLLYQCRWQIEIFFRFLKHILGCRHLLSQCRNGIELQMYSAILACLLIALWTGRKPALSTYRMLQHYFAGWASEDELLAHIEKLKIQA